MGSADVVSDEQVTCVRTQQVAPVQNSPADARHADALSVDGAQESGASKQH